MWALILTTIFTSAVDSLNPFAITQQFILQGMVKKPKHILYFIIPTGITNLIGGYLAYYGIITIIGGFLNTIVKQYGVALYTVELILGIAFLIFAGMLLQNRKFTFLKKEIAVLKGIEEKSDKNTAKKIKSVSPLSLISLGVIATLSELTTALPYFAFLAILFNYHLSFLNLSFILILYNLIYTLPLLLLFLLYIKAQDKFDRLYTIIKTQIAKWSDILAPILVALIGTFLIFHSVSLLV